MKIMLLSPEKVRLNVIGAPSLCLKAGVEHEFKTTQEAHPYRHHIKALVDAKQMKITRFEFVDQPPVEPKSKVPPKVEQKMEVKAPVVESKPEVEVPVEKPAEQKPVLKKKPQ